MQDQVVRQPELPSGPVAVTRTVFPLRTLDRTMVPATALLPTYLFERAARMGVWSSQTSQVAYLLCVLVQEILGILYSGNQELISELLVDSFHVAHAYFTSHGVTMCLFLFSILCGLSSFVQCMWFC